jgi:hypothetical protein
MRLITALFLSLLAVSTYASSTCPLTPDTLPTTENASETLLMAPVSKYAPYPYIVQNEATGEIVNGYCVYPANGYSEWLAWSPNRALISLSWEDFQEVFYETNPTLSLAQSDAEYAYYLRKDMRWFVPRDNWHTPSSEEYVLMTGKHQEASDTTAANTADATLDNIVTQNFELENEVAMLESKLLAAEEKSATLKALLRNAQKDNATLTIVNEVLRAQNSLLDIKKDTAALRVSMNHVNIAFIILVLLLFVGSAYFFFALRKKNAELREAVQAQERKAETYREELVRLRGILDTPPTTRPSD